MIFFQSKQNAFNGLNSNDDILDQLSIGFDYFNAALVFKICHESISVEFLKAILDKKSLVTLDLQSYSSTYQYTYTIASYGDFCSLESTSDICSFHNKTADRPKVYNSGGKLLEIFLVG